MKLVFATNNLHKLKEVQEMLSNAIEVLSLKDIGCFEDIEETESTLEGNAKLKANYITEKYGFDCFADDTGLEVEALYGNPGVYSARYAGEHGNAEKNMEKLLNELQNKSSRKAKFRTIIALNLKNKQYLFEGICDGEILNEKTGVKGFGYDPIFKPKNASCSFAEMNSEEKNIISHRGIAIQKLVNFLSLIKITQ
ncbi:non-canonical purine NTP diphosphatase [Flavobacteriaceae bacterium]|nr:non-canonical purine NTP diphosphatase [Flavobacteriaceae bacterium]